MPDVKFSNQYPYTDFHELNLDWVISQVKYWSTKVGKTIQSIDLTGTVGLVDTYTITYSDGSTSTFDVTNGNGIASVAKTGTAGLVDTYTITFQDGSTSTFEVTNGTAAVVQTTGTNTSEVMSQNAVTEELDAKLDKYTSMVNQNPAVITGYLISCVDESLLASSINEYIKYTVTPGTKYTITGWHVNSTYCGLSYVSGGVLNRLTSTVGAFSLTITIPSDVTTILVNGRTSDGPISIYKEERQTSADFYDELQSFYNRYSYDVAFANNGDLTIDTTDFKTGSALRTKFAIKGGNSLPDIRGFYLLNNGTETPISDSATDYLSPSVVYAVNNMDGDFPDLTSGKLTGGWHRYNSSTTTGTATARNITYKVMCDGVEMSRGNSTKCRTVYIYIVNRIQGSNTEKVDGSGREIVEQSFMITMNGTRIEISGTIEALEAIKYDAYYGVSVYFSNTSNAYFVGSRAVRGSVAVTGTVRSQDKYANAIRQKQTDATLEMGFDPTIDLGTEYANNWTNSVTVSSQKAYAVLIYGGSDPGRLVLNTGDRVYWSGYYQVQPTI